MRSPRIFPTNLLYWLNILCVLIVSYRRADEVFALRLIQDLKAAGANVWFDQLDIPPGMPWDLAIGDALSKCPSMMVILSTVSVGSVNVRDDALP